VRLSISTNEIAWRADASMTKRRSHSHRPFLIAALMCLCELTSAFQKSDRKGGTAAKHVPFWP
jgi:hypothetical protein